ncbi:MAG: V4R domain-containing protein [Gemmatimonadota bacterium]
MLSTELASGRVSGRILQSHFYDAALHRAITETGTVDVRESLERAAASAALAELSAAGRQDSADREITGLLERTGSGTVERITAEGDQVEVVLSSSPHAAARVEMFGTASAPACDIVRGLISGCLTAVHGMMYRVEERACLATGAERCVFVAVLDPDTPEPEAGSPSAWPERIAGPPADPAFPPGDVLAPLWAFGDRGISGASYGELWGDVYARTAYEFEDEVPRQMGAKYANLASVVLTEAAHLGAFYSLGGLLRSPEWTGEVAPTLPAREEWVHAIVALLDQFGWGAWRIRLLAPEQRFTVEVHGGFEARWHLAHHGTAVTPRCHFAKGVVAATMNVVYGGDILGPDSLDQSLYNLLFRSPLSYRSIETRCMAMGDPHCEFVANPLSAGLRTLSAGLRRR